MLEDSFFSRSHRLLKSTFLRVHQRASETDLILIKTTANPSYRFLKLLNGKDSFNNDVKDHS